MSGWGLRIARRGALAALGVSGMLALTSASAGASQPAPGLEVTGRSLPTNLAPGNTGVLSLELYNVGGADTNGQFSVTDALPPGVTATSPLYYIGENEELELAPFDLECSGVGTSLLVCTSPPGLPGRSPVLHAGEQLQLLAQVSVSNSAAEGSELNHATVAGAGAPVPASTTDSITLSSTLPGFGFSGFDGWFTNADGTPDTQAGSHPYELTVSFDLNSIKDREAPEWEPHPAGGQIRSVDVSLPPGILGNPTAAPRCTRQQFDGNQFLGECPAATQIGVDTVGIGLDAERISELVLPVYNLVPPMGVPAEFGFYILGNKIILNAGVRTGGDYGITEHVTNLPQGDQLIFNSITIWGVPGEASHDPQRRGSGSGCVENVPPAGHGCSYPGPLRPFLTLPTSCAGPQTFMASAAPWEFANVTGEASFLTHDNNETPIGFTGCDRLDFAPSIGVSPDTGQADTPAGMIVDVKAAQEGLTTELTEGFESRSGYGNNPQPGLSASDIRDTTVTLPEGVVINPGQAAGLAACQPSQDAIGTEDAPSCPLASRVGAVQIETPLLPHDLEGDVYVLQSNPPHLQLLLAASGEGVNLKLVGDVSLDPVTGRLTTTFKNTPELPFTHLRLAFSGGAQAALETPTGCGTYTATSDFTPWSHPFLQDVFPSSSFAIVSGPSSTPCASPLSFAPTMIAGSTTDQAAGYTNFSLLLQRDDGQQRLSSLQFKTPEGLLGMISKVPLCQEPQAAQGTCSSASQIGHTVVEAGPGPYPLVVPQPGQSPAPIYLTGPYKGAPYGLSIVVPLVVGPFTLQTQIVRARIDVDPQTARLTVTTDPLPTIIDGIPADLRTINAVIDRPGFMFNPTNCSPQVFTGAATSTEGATAPLESHFQMGSCRSLSFKPTFKASASGKPSRTNGVGLDVKVLYPNPAPGNNQASSQANLASVKVNLPKQLPSRLTTLQKACPDTVYNVNPTACPAASRVGTATTTTPVLPVALSGPVYFVSHGARKFPDLVIVLQGYGVTVELDGETFISKQGITSTTFRALPDVPFESFELKLPQGPYSALAGNGNLCTVRGGLKMPTILTAQNGLQIRQSTKISVSGCPKAVKVKAKRKKRKA